MLVNSFFVVSYVGVIQHDQFLFLGYRPDLTVSCPAIEWVVFFGDVGSRICTSNEVID